MFDLPYLHAYRYLLYCHNCNTKATTRCTAESGDSDHSIPSLPERATADGSIVDAQGHEIIDGGITCKLIRVSNIQYFRLF